MDTVTLYYQVQPRNIVTLKSLLEGYEGLLVVRTKDPEQGIVQLLVSPDYKVAVKNILTELSGFLWIQTLPEDPDV